MDPGVKCFPCNMRAFVWIPATMEVVDAVVPLCNFSAVDARIDRSWGLNDQPNITIQSISKKNVWRINLAKDKEGLYKEN